MSNKKISSKKQEFKITTFDNPFSPFTHFDEWYTFDIQHGYDTLGVLGRMTMSSKQLSMADQKRIFESSIFDLVKMFPSIYKIVLEGDYSN